MKQINWRGARLTGLAVAVSLSVALAACSAGPGADANNGVIEIPIGASVEVTGGASILGTEWKRGIELAIDAANGDGGFTVDGKQYRWKLELKDNQSLPDQAIANYREFVGAGMNFILGPNLSTALPPAFNSLGGASPFILTPANGTSLLETPGAENLFMTHLADVGPEGRVAKMVQILVDKYQPKKVAILLPQDAPGELYTSTFGESFAKAGVEIVYSEAFPADTRDFASYITAMKATTPELVLSGYLDTWMTPLLTQAEGAGFITPVFVGAPGTNVTSLQPGSKIKNFAWSITTRAVNNTEDSTVQGYRDAYQAKFGAAPGATGFWGLSYYDPILLLTEALVRAGSVDDLKAINEAFLSINDWKGGVLNERFDSTSHRAVYGAQVGFFENGVTTYVEAKG